MEYCLRSVLKAGANIAMEVIVADNHSTDNSRTYLQPAFPTVKFIWLEENAGFSRANNIALKQATGEYILLLNPDTIIPEDCFEKCIAFFASHASAGALGVRMVNGKGVFLKESKRGFPTLPVSFFKFSGIVQLFPYSRFFARYYMGHLPETEVNKVDVLSGACMFVRSKTLAVTGGFDEAFFMYGEDIDLSYRIQKSGVDNYYYPGVTIIHFKGESTTKTNGRHIRTFYNAMQIFVHKHYPSLQAFVYKCLVSLLMLVSIVVNAFRNAFFSALRSAKAPLSNITTTIMVAGSEEEYKGVMNIISKEKYTVKKIKIEQVITDQLPLNENGSELVLCEGERSFKEIINTLILLPAKYRVWFYALGSKSIITAKDGKSKAETGFPG